MVMLPEDGELRLGPAALPTGRRIFAMGQDEDPETVALIETEIRPYAFSSERHHALSDDSISGIAAALAGTPIWTFWWD